MADYEHEQITLRDLMDAPWKTDYRVFLNSNLVRIFRTIVQYIKIRLG